MRPGRRLRGFHKGRFCSRIVVYKPEFVWELNKAENPNRKVNTKENVDGVIG